MADVTLVQYDTAPSITGTLAVGLAVPDLDGATVKLQMRLTTSNLYVVNRAAEIVDEEDGTVRYDWLPGDTDIPGDYVARWEITYADLTVQHSEAENTVLIDPA